MAISFMVFINFNLKKKKKFYLIFFRFCSRCRNRCIWLVIYTGLIIIFVKHERSTSFDQNFSSSICAGGVNLRRLDNQRHQKNVLFLIISLLAFEKYTYMHCNNSLLSNVDERCESAQ